MKRIKKSELRQIVLEEYRAIMNESKSKKPSVNLQEMRRMQELAGIKPLNEERDDVGKYNTVAKVVSKLGRRPSEQELADFIINNYYDVTEVELGDSNPYNQEKADNKIADLVGYFKIDTDDWKSVWEDAQNK